MWTNSATGETVEGTFVSSADSAVNIETADGTIATIYDYKRYDDDLGAPELDEVYKWHIGGQGKAAVYAVSGALGTGADIA
jgi:hypothetical protein